MKYLHIKNWEKFQHYKDRNPPWIKLHRDLLRDYDFICLQDASKLHLMLIWLLGSQLDNKIPADEDFIKKQIGVSGKIDFNELINNGFLIDASGELALCKQDAIPETETETETETEFRVPLKNGSFFCPSVLDIAGWEKQNPGVNVGIELLKLVSWNQNNPAKRKTVSGIKRHISSWLSNSSQKTKKQDDDFPQEILYDTK